MAPPTTHLLALLTRFCYDDAVAPNEHRKKDLLDVLMKDSMFAVTACLDALHEALIPDRKDKRAPFPDSEPDIKHAMEALKAFGILCNVCGGDSAISDVLIARWPSALAWVRFLNPSKRNLRPCPDTLYARPADAVAQAVAGYVQLLYNKGILDDERLPFKTLLRFWENFPCHFPMTAGVGEEPREADILFRGRDAAMTELLLRVLTAPDPNARAAAVEAVLAEGHGSAKALMCAAARRMTISQGFAYIPRERYAHEFPRLEDHIVLRYRYAEVCVALVELTPLHKFLETDKAARDVINAFHFFSMVSFDRAAALKVCKVLAVLCGASFKACEAALKKGVLVALHRFLTPRAGDIIQIRLNKGVNDLAPIRMLADTLASALVVRPVLKAFGETVVKYGILYWEIPPSKIWYRLMTRFALRQLSMDAFRGSLICELCHEEGDKFCCADTYYCSAACQAADRERHRPYCNGPTKGTAFPNLKIFGLGSRDDKSVVYAAHCEMQRKGQVWRTIAAFVQRPAVVKSGRDVHARLDYRKPRASVTLCLSTGAMREADPDEDHNCLENQENKENKENSAPTKTVLAITHQTAKATPRVIVDAVFDRSLSIVVPVGMYRFSFFAPTIEFKPKPKLQPKPKFERKPKFKPVPKLELMPKPKRELMQLMPKLEVEPKTIQEPESTETSKALTTVTISEVIDIDFEKLSYPEAKPCSASFFVCVTPENKPRGALRRRPVPENQRSRVSGLVNGLRDAFALRRN